MLEIHTLVELSTYLDKHRSLKDVVVQSVDVSSIVEAVVAAKIENTVFLGCQIPDDALCSLVKVGAHIFPALTGLPFNPYQPVLYNAKSLFDGFDGKDPCSYCKTLDARVYQYGLAIANVASLLDPRMIVVGGDIHEVMEMSVERLNKIIGLSLIHI